MTDLEKQRLRELREEYKTADPARRQALEEEAALLKAPTCYYKTEEYSCPIKVLESNPEFPFCSKKHHEAWSDVHLPKKPSTLEQARARALQIAEEIREGKQRRIFNG